MSESIYDFHDGSEDIDDDDYQKLIIDEKPSKKVENLTSLRLKISSKYRANIFFKYFTI